MNAKKEIVNVVKLNKPIIEGKEYYYMVDGKISRGTALKCDKCQRWCTGNSVTILSFNTPVKTIEVAELSDDELSYCEKTDESLCDNCYVHDEVSDEH